MPNLRTKVLLVFSLLYFVLILITDCGTTGVLSEVRVFPSSASVGLSQTKQFIAGGYDSSGSPVAIDPTWSIFGGLGTVDAEGLFYAGSQIGTAYIAASASGFSGQSAVIITDKGAIAGKVKNNLGSGINGITVTATQASVSSETNSKGSYSISNLSEGTYTIETEATARYLSSSSEAAVTMAETSTLNFTLGERIVIVTSNANRVGSTMSISGTVKNNGTSTATGCTVIYVYYDEENDPLGNGSSTVGTITAGSTEAFILTVSLNDAKDPSRTDSYGIAGGF